MIDTGNVTSCLALDTTFLLHFLQFSFEVLVVFDPDGFFVFDFFWLLRQLAEIGKNSCSNGCVSFTLVSEVRNFEVICFRAFTLLLNVCEQVCFAGGCLISGRLNADDCITLCYYGGDH